MECSWMIAYISRYHHIYVYIPFQVHRLTELYHQFAQWMASVHRGSPMNILGCFFRELSPLRSTLEISLTHYPVSLLFPRQVEVCRGLPWLLLQRTVQELGPSVHLGATLVR